MKSARRLFFKRYDTTGKFPDGRVKLDVHFEDSEGGQYVWTPDWKGTKAFFLEASRIEGLNVPGGPQSQGFKQVAEKVVQEQGEKPTQSFKLYVLKLGGYLTHNSHRHIDMVASAVFEFPVSEHPHPGAPSKVQHTYNWIMTLAEQPLSGYKKRNLLEQFVAELAPSDSEAQSTAKEIVKTLSSAWG